MSLNVQQAYENVQAVAESAAFLFHFRTIPDTIVAPDGRVMSGSSEAVGDVNGSIAASTSETFYWVRELETRVHDRRLDVGPSVGSVRARAGGRGSVPARRPDSSLQ
jgi:hypothetical protein